MMFYGEFDHNIDDKGRLTIPAKFRSRFAGGAVVTKGIDRCLWLLPMDAWEDLASKVSQLAMTNPTAREYRRQVFGSASHDVPDRQGRVQIPEYLLKYAGIDKQASVVGLHSYCEIWDQAEWRQRQELSHNDPEGRANMFASLGI